MKKTVLTSAITNILFVSLIFLFLLWMMIYEESPKMHLIALIDVIIAAIILLIVILKSAFAVFNIKMPKLLATVLRVVTIVISIPFGILLLIFMLDSGKNSGTFISVIRILLLVAVVTTLLIYTLRALRSDSGKENK